VSNIHESIRHLAVPIDTLVPLDGNPRKGNVDAIVASYREFGQVKPVVVRRNADGTATVIAGNHQVEACRRLGWSEVAVVELSADDARAVAFALADNRTHELGSTDDDLLYEMLDRAEGFDDLFDALGWDDFEFASMEDDYRNDDDNTYVAPVMRDLDEPVSMAPVMPPVTAVRRDDGETELVAPASVNTSQAITQGAPSVVNNPTKAVVQYTLVFDSAEQQRKWYDFIRWLKADAGYDGDTTAERLLNFIDSHANY
jgi:ParB-like chromosome segregation protein Spo0J